MLRPWRSVVARFSALVRTEAAGLRQGFAALLISSGGDLLAGLALAGMTGTLDRLPGLIVLVPAAIGMRGNIFGALGSRLGTSIHAGTFSLSRRLDTPVGQNLGAAIVLSLTISLVLAVLAKAVAVAFHVQGAVSIVDFVVISVIGGVLSSVFVAGITMTVAGASVRRNWDLDNVAAPIVTAAGDVVTLPSLWAATFLIGISWVTPALAGLCVIVGVGALVFALRSKARLLRRIVLESLPVLALAGVVDILAGQSIETRLESFIAYKALLVMVPPFLEDAGALGSILASRLSTKLHLGLIEPTRLPTRAIAEDVLLIYLFAFPVFMLVGVSSTIAAAIVGFTSPGLLEMIGVALLGGFMATTAAVVVAFYSATGTYRFGLDPDNHSVAIVTSSLDLFGAFSLILALLVLGLA